MAQVQSPREVGARFGWRVWPGTNPASGLCRCPSPCPFPKPHPLGSTGEAFALATEQQIARAWSSHPNATPLLLADDHLDLVGADTDVALAVLDYLADHEQILRPVVMHHHHGLAVFLVAPDETRRWREYAGFRRGITLPPWTALPTEHSDEHLSWHVPPTPTNATSPATHAELSAAFAAGLYKAGFE